MSTSRTAGVRCGEISANCSSVSSSQLDRRAPRSAGRRRRRPRGRPGTARPRGPATRRRRWRARSPAGASSAIRCGVEGQRRDHPGEGRQQHLEGVDGVEDRLLVLLEVAVVGQRQRLERGEQPGQVADQPPGLAAGELGDVGVLLLRHDARPGRPGVVQRHEAELAGRPEDDLLGEPADVDADLRGDEGELGDEVAGGRAVDGVGAGAGEAELGGDRLGVEAEAGAGQRPGAVRRVRGDPGVPVARAARRRAAAARRARAGGGTAAPAGRAGGGCGPA